jgi:predicted unusual protein kinase regulating ubiquinone biosynthesis (AarF/ABC1/UbiB family)
MMCLSRGFSSFHADAHPGNFMVPGLCLVSYI